MSTDDTARLAQSRREMAHWLDQHPPSDFETSADPLSALQSAPLPCKANPWVAMAVSSLGIRMLGARREQISLWNVAGTAAQAMLKPSANRHPWALMAGASLLGAGLVACRPWRMAGQRSVWANLSAQLALQVLRQMSAASSRRAEPNPPSSPLPGPR